MKKVNITEKIQAFNEVRLQFQGKTLSSSELYKVLTKNGIATNIIKELIKQNIIESIRNGKTAQYFFSKEPLYKDILEKIYIDRREYIASRRSAKKVSPSEKAIDLLKEQGYQVRICKGFDEEKFAKENPELYKKYLIYEVL